jgi:acetyl-CoA synthetase
MRDPLPGAHDLAAACAAEAPGFTPDFTGADDPALLMYTSGSTGKPKGILHGHRVLAAYAPSIALFFNLSMADEDAVFWSPSDWAWVGGLLDMLFPAWMAGRPIATSLDRFSAEQGYRFMARHRVTHTFLAPTAIKRLAQTPDPRAQHDLALRVICTGGESLAAETLDWAERRLGVVCNEFYGMTEVNHLIGNCAALFRAGRGRWGRPTPGIRWCWSMPTAPRFRTASRAKSSPPPPRPPGSSAISATPRKRPRCGLARGCAPMTSRCGMQRGISGTRAGPTT